MKQRPRTHGNAVPYGRCQTCRVPLLQPQGYGATGLCGPCCTGEADTAQETTEPFDPRAAEKPEGR